MADHVTSKLLDTIASDVSDQLAGNLFVSVGDAVQNGLYLCERRADGSRSVIRALTHGTKRELHTYLSAMRETLYIVGRDY